MGAMCDIYPLHYAPMAAKVGLRLCQTQFFFAERENDLGHNGREVMRKRENEDREEASRKGKADKRKCIHYEKTRHAGPFGANSWSGYGELDGCRTGQPWEGELYDTVCMHLHVILHPPFLLLPQIH